MIRSGLRVAIAARSAGAADENAQRDEAVQHACVPARSRADAARSCHGHELTSCDVNISVGIDHRALELERAVRQRVLAVVCAHLRPDRLEAIVLRRQSDVGVQRHKMLVFDVVDADLARTHDPVHVAAHVEVVRIGLNFKSFKMRSS